MSSVMPVPPDADLREDFASRIEKLPKEVGAVLVSVGVVGVVLPGIAGAPALIAGGLALWPGWFRKVDRRLREQNPKLHGNAMKQIGRFLDDLERRYPTPAGNDAPMKPRDQHPKPPVDAPGEEPTQL